MTRTRVLAVLAGLAVAGIVAASAAQLDVNADDLGAGVTTVASCDEDGVDVEFTGIAYNETIPGAEVTEVTITGIAVECDGQTLDLTFMGIEPGNADLGEGTVVLTDSGTAEVTGFELANNPVVVDASEVYGVSVVITGEPA